MRLSEKYRPESWDDFVGEEVKQELKNFYLNPKELLGILRRPLKKLWQFLVSLSFFHYTS